MPLHTCLPRVSAFTTFSFFRKDVIMTIGEKIRAAREAKGLTIDELSSISGVDNRHIGKYEENKMMPRYTTLNKLADALDVKITTLYNDEKDKADSEAAAEEKTADIPPENIVPPDTLHRFAEQFRFLREEGGLSFDDIAEATDIPADMLETFENEDNYPNIVVLECLANYFGVTTDYLLGKPFLSEQECRFLKFVSHLEILTELHYKNILPTELYVLCRNALVADFI